MAASSHLSAQARSPREYAVAGVAFIAAACALMMGIAVSGSVTGRTLVWVALTAAILLTTIGLRLSRTSGSVFDPLTLVCLVLFAYYVTHTIWVLQQPPFGFPGIGRPFHSALPRAQEVIAFSSIALVVGYSLVPRARTVVARRRPAPDLTSAPVSLLLGIFAAGMAFQYLSYRAGNGGETRNVLVYQTLGSIASASFVLASAKLYTAASEVEAQRLRRIVYWLMLPVQALWALTEGHKLDLVIVVLTLLVVREALGRRFGLRRLTIAALVFLLVLTPLVNDARKHRSSAHALIGSTLLKNVADGLAHPSLTSAMTLSRPWNLVQKRTGGVDSLALAMEYTPSVRGYVDGRSLAAVPLGLVPHFVWPGKPTYDIGREFSIVYAGQQVSQGAGLTVAPTIPGDLYLNFGVEGVVGGFLLLGVALQLITRMIEGGRPSDLRLLVYASLLVPFILVEQDIATVAGREITTVVAAVGVAVFVRRFGLRSPGAGIRGVGT